MVLKLLPISVLTVSRKLRNKTIILSVWRTKLQNKQER